MIYCKIKAVRVAAPIVDVGHGFGHRRLTLRNIYAPYSAWDIANPTFRKGITEVVIEDSWAYNFFVYSNPDRLVFRRCRIDENSAVKAVNSSAEPYVKLHSFRSKTIGFSPDSRYTGFPIDVTFESCIFRGTRSGNGLIGLDFWLEPGDSRDLPQFGTINIIGNTTLTISNPSVNNSVVRVGNVVGGAGNLNIIGPANPLTNTNSLILDTGGMGRGVFLYYSLPDISAPQKDIRLTMNFTRVLSSSTRPVLLASPAGVQLGVLSGTDCSPVLAQPIADSPTPPNFTGTITFTRTS